MRGHAYEHYAVSCAQTAELIEMPFWLSTRVGRRKRVCVCVLQREHWCHLANTIEQCVCCGDAALCQITLAMHLLDSKILNLVFKHTR